MTTPTNPFVVQANVASLNGGGIFRSGGAGNMELCLFQNNTAKKLGGAFYDSQASGSSPDNQHLNGLPKSNSTLS